MYSSVYVWTIAEVCMVCKISPQRWERKLPKYLNMQCVRFVTDCNKAHRSQTPAETLVWTGPEWMSSHFWLLHSAAQWSNRWAQTQTQALAAKDLQQNSISSWCLTGQSTVFLHCPHSLTHSGWDVFQMCLQSAASFFCIVCNVGLQEWHTKLSLIHHPYQTASGFAWNLAFHHHRHKSVIFHAYVSKGFKEKLVYKSYLDTDQPDIYVSLCWSRCKIVHHWLVLGCCIVWFVPGSLAHNCYYMDPTLPS